MMGLDLVTLCALERSPYAAMVVSWVFGLQEPAPLDHAPAAQTCVKAAPARPGLTTLLYSVKLQSSTRMPGTRLLPVER